jgi:RNA polymerase sigma-70 factor (ECF subfamily)
MNTTKLSDEEILQRYKDLGNVEYFGELFNRYITLLYGTYLKYLGSAEKAQESVLQLFENLLANIANYEIKVFRTWIYFLVKSHCRLLMLEKSEIVVDFVENKIDSDAVLHLLDHAEKSEEGMNILRQNLRQLPVEQRIAIIRFFIEGMSYADIVDSTGYNLTQIKDYIQEGRNNLKICLEKNK